MREFANLQEIYVNLRVDAAIVLGRLGLGRRIWRGGDGGGRLWSGSSDGRGAWTYYPLRASEWLGSDNCVYRVLILFFGGIVIRTNQRHKSLQMLHRNASPRWLVICLWFGGLLCCNRGGDQSTPFDSTDVTSLDGNDSTTSDGAVQLDIDQWSSAESADSQLTPEADQNEGCLMGAFAIGSTAIAGVNVPIILRGSNPQQQFMTWAATGPVESHVQFTSLEGKNWEMEASADTPGEYEYCATTHDALTGRTSCEASCFHVSVLNSAPKKWSIEAIPVSASDASGCNAQSLQLHIALPNNSTTADRDCDGLGDPWNIQGLDCTNANPVVNWYDLGAPLNPSWSEDAQGLRIAFDATEIMAPDFPVAVALLLPKQSSCPKIQVRLQLRLYGQILVSKNALPSHWYKFGYLNSCMRRPPQSSVDSQILGRSPRGPGARSPWRGLGQRPKFASFFEPYDRTVGRWRTLAHTLVSGIELSLVATL